MSAPSLRSRIRTGTMLLLGLAAVFAVSALPSVYRLGGSIRETLYRNYVSIDAAQHMHAAIRKLELAERDGKAQDMLSECRGAFMYWMDVEDHDFTEIGEPELAGDIERRAKKLFDEVAASAPSARHDREFEELHSRIDDLIEMNRAAMFRADSRAVKLGARLTYEFAAGLGLLLIAGVALSWGLGWALSMPLTELAERLRGLSQRKAQTRLGPQKLAELEAVASEFNQMAEKLEQYEKLNVQRLVYEKSKTEAIIEGLEDGVLLIDAEGTVTHINEIATLILGLQTAEALGSPFDDLSSNSAQYLKVRDALRTLGRPGSETALTEVQLHFRGRDHQFVLKPVALRQTDGQSFGTLLILRDITGLREQDRTRLAARGGA